MAKGLGRLSTLMGFVGLVALGVTVSMMAGFNPWTYASDKLGGIATTRVTDPAPRWATRAGNQVTGAALTGDAAVLVSHEGVEGRRLDTGDRLWTVPGEWVLPAGPVVVVGHGGGKGFEVVDTARGETRWSEKSGLRAWAYSDMILVLSCANQCKLAARSPRDGAVRWQTRVDGRDLSPAYEPPAVAVTGVVAAAPAVVALPVDGKLQLVESGTGRRLPDMDTGDRQTRVAVLGGRVVSIHGTRADGGCRQTIAGRDPASGRELWHRDGYDPHTTSGVGCEQRRNPAGAGGVLVATRGDKREALLDVATGAERWVGEPGQKVVATDGRVAVIRADKNLYGVDVERGVRLWTREVARSTKAAVAGGSVLLTDPEHLIALDSRSGRVRLDVKTGAVPLAVDNAGVLVGRGRVIGYCTF